MDERTIHTICFSEKRSDESRFTASITAERSTAKSSTGEGRLTAEVDLIAQHEHVHRLGDVLATLVAVDLLGLDLAADISLQALT